MSRAKKYTKTYGYRHLKKEFPRMLKGQIQRIAVEIMPQDLYKYLKSNGFVFEDMIVSNNILYYSLVGEKRELSISKDLADGGFKGKYTIQNVTSRT